MCKLKILFDARFITPQRTGVGAFAESLLKALAGIGGAHRVHALYYDDFVATSAVTKVRAPVPFDAHPMGDIYRVFRLPRFLNKNNYAVFYSPAFYSLGRNCRIPQVVNIHDLSVFDHPETYSNRFGVYFRHIIRTSISRASVLIVPSQFIRNRLISHFPASENKLRVIPFGVDSEFFRCADQDIAQVREKLCLPDRFLLSVSTIEARKNLLRLLDAYAIYRRRTNRPIPLIMVGKDGYRSQRIHERSLAADMGFDVRFVGYLNRKEVQALYHTATAFLYPSLYEGFGFPVLEAMASGCPVVASNSTSIPEVAGDCSVAVDPTSAEDIARGMLTVTEDADYRSELVEKGIQHAGLFTWEKTARRILNLLNELSENK